MGSHLGEWVTAGVGDGADAQAVVRSYRLLMVIIRRSSTVWQQFRIKEFGEGSVPRLGEELGVADGTIGKGVDNFL